MFSFCVSNLAFLTKRAYFDRQMFKAFPLGHTQFKILRKTFACDCVCTRCGTENIWSVGAQQLENERGRGLWVKLSK